MDNKNYILTLNLQTFAEGGGDGGTGAEGTPGETAVAAVPQTKGVKSNPLADVKYGIQEEAQTTDVQSKSVETPDRNAEFDKLIKGEYKDLYDAKMQDAIQKRLKNSKETVEKYNALTPTLELLAKKYGIKDASDIDALNKAIEEDDAYYEEEALEKGISVEQLKEIRKMEKENAELKRQMEEQGAKERASKLYSAWLNQSEATKSVYPSFDLQTEMQNPRFVELLKSNVDVRTAYEVLHMGEIIPSAMQFTAKKVEQKLADKMIANGARPSENGNSAQSAARTKSDVSQLSNADMDEVIRRARQGERISFG